MLSPKSHEFDQISTAKVPFSWELKPGVSRNKNKTEDHQLHQWKLTPPPCLHVEYNTEEVVLQSPLALCPFTPSNIGRSSRSNISSFRKRVDDDPFLEAYRKCLERSPMRVSSLRRSIRDQERYSKNKKKSLLLWLWSKYSCKVGTDGWSTVSRFLKVKPKKRTDTTE